MEFEKFENILQKHRQAMREYRVNVQVAQAHVDATEALIKILREKRQKLAGVISYEVAQERNRLTALINKNTAELNKRKEELADAMCNGQRDDMINKLIQ